MHKWSYAPTNNTRTRLPHRDLGSKFVALHAFQRETSPLSDCNCYDLQSVILLNQPFLIMSFFWRAYDSLHQKFSMNYWSYRDRSPLIKKKLFKSPQARGAFKHLKYDSGELSTNIKKITFWTLSIAGNEFSSSLTSFSEWLAK